MNDQVWDSVCAALTEHDYNLYFTDSVTVLQPRYPKCAKLFFVGGSDVVQEPILWKAKGSSTVMECLQNKGVSYYLMYWYKQRPGETMKLIVITNAYGGSEFGDVDENKFEVLKK